MKKILVVVDMQNDFLTGTLANKSAVSIIPNIKREIESGHYDQIIFTKDTHQKNYLDTPEGKKLPVPHCIEGTDGWNVCRELTDSVGNRYYTVINKPTFGYTGWNQIEDDPETEITFTGTVASICVVSNALIVKAMLPNVSVRCISDCVSGLDDQNKMAAIEVMRSCQIDIV